MIPFSRGAHQILDPFAQKPHAAHDILDFTVSSYYILLEVARTYLDLEDFRVPWAILWRASNEFSVV